MHVSSEGTALIATDTVIPIAKIPRMKYQHRLRSENELYFEGYLPWGFSF